MTAKGARHQDRVRREEFFWDCVEHEAAEAERKRVFYFRIDSVPIGIGAMYGRDTDEALWRPLWPEYLASKYKALTVLNRRPRTRSATVARQVGLDEGWEKIVERWRQMAPRERLVFQLRAEQIGDVQTVKDTWYDEIDGIDDWIDSCLDAVADDRHSDGDGSSPAAIDDTGLALTAATLSLAIQGERRLDKYVDVLIATVKAHFSASVVDFLVVRRRHPDEELELFATSALVKEEVRYALEREASYSRPTGITGSVLVARAHHTMFHVGTNDLEHDPRQSPEHRSAYERSYGELRNFWVFPVHVNGVLLGALRVVNRLGGDGDVVSWPYPVRRRLVGLMTLIAALWQVCELTLDDHAADGVTGEHVGVALDAAADRQASALEALVSRERLRLVGENLASMLGALANLASIRIEERPLDVSMVVVGEDRVSNPEDLLPSMRFEALSSMPSLAELGNGGTTLVVASDGRVMGRYLLPVAGAGAVGFSRQFDVELVLEIAADSDRVLHIWRDGRYLADYVFLPRLGVWAVRDFEAGAEELSRKTDVPAEAVEDALRRAVRLSYAHGATLVLQATHSQDPLSSSGERCVASLASLSEKEFVDLASLDGAVVMSDGMISSFKETLPTDAPADATEATRRRLPKARDKLRRSLRGKRHESALCASAHHPDAVVLCASENRTVCAFVAGEDVLWDF